MKRFAALLLAVALILPACAGREDTAVPDSYDIVIYGGTAAGVIAAAQAVKLGRSAVLIEPGRHLGGLTTGGLGATDIGNKSAIGGLSREFYRRISEYYSADSAWRYEKREEYQSNRGDDVDERYMWTFEPHVAEKIISGLIEEAGVAVVFGEHLDLDSGVEKQEDRITSIRMESGRLFRGKMFIDASYEGDLLALAGVSYHVGREANAQYGETLNGVQTANAVYHQFNNPVSPYLEPGNPSSGLLPGIDPAGPGEEGAGDKRLQAYNFRMCLTDVPENRIPFEKPGSYEPLRYEPLLRYFEAGYESIPWGPTRMPNRKTDTNNRDGFSTDFIGESYTYPEADYDIRQNIVQRHLEYQKGLMWCLANEPRVPAKIREEVSRWGLARDEFQDNGGWSQQIYVREARRMIGSYVMTQHNCQGREVAPDPVGMAAYTMDSHNVQRYVDRQGQLRNEGDVQVGDFPPYPISYRAIIPQTGECGNLLVPVCLSATHISYGSIRMEPVFMVLGQSAATAAAQAIDENKSVQEIDYARLKESLLSQGQVLQ